MTNQPTREELIQWMIDHVAEETRMPKDKIETDKPFARYNLESIAAVSLTADLEDLLGTNLSPTLFWDFPSIEGVVNYLLKNVVNKSQTA
ncbi:acyl carrier protein [Pontibacter sp. G13]|uniref:acyl carrier protein n=1 Tax=Pontibacter sp. G13 TaxID=3074898 RepID=UPI00288AFD5B|nr:acyl carrier protein [Pontibacter sp. G13]WNJ19783.1 acyl carrier protein [Pontibacter sp. G13]